jgi:hypothetical protein
MNFPVSKTSLSLEVGQSFRVRRFDVRDHLCSGNDGVSSRNAPLNGGPTLAAQSCFAQLSELTGGFQRQNQAEIKWCLIASKTKSALLLRLNDSMM